MCFGRLQSYRIFCKVFQSSFAEVSSLKLHGVISDLPDVQAVPMGLDMSCCISNKPCCSACPEPSPPRRGLAPTQRRAQYGFTGYADRQINGMDGCGKYIHTFLTNALIERTGSVVFILVPAVREMSVCVGRAVTAEWQAAL